MTVFSMPTRTASVSPSAHMDNMCELAVLSLVHVERGKSISSHSLTRVIKTHPGWRIPDDSRPPERL